MGRDVWRKLEEYDTYQNLLHIMKNMGDADSELGKFRRMIEENIDADSDYRSFMLHITKKQDSFRPNKRQRENYDNDDDDDDDDGRLDDYCGGEMNDPLYERFLKCLTKHGNSYILKYEKNGKHIVFKYEEEVHLDENGDAEPGRKLRNQTSEPSNQMPDVGMQHSHGSQSKGKLRHKTGTEQEEEEENVEYTTDKSVPNSVNLTCRTPKVVDERDASLDKNCYQRPRTRLRSGMNLRSESSNSMPSSERRNKHDVQSTYKTMKLTGKSTEFNTGDIVPDDDYLNLLKHHDIINGKLVYTYEGIKIVYEADGEECIQVKQEHDDESYSEVEIIDSISVCKINENISNGSPTMTSAFRQRLIKVLKKAYTRQEYDKLWQDIKLQKPQERHLELRHGRELSCTKYIDGKSLLDHYPDLKRKLMRYKDDKPKCLNLLRGFFFWLQNSPSDESFIPWKDEDCIAIRPKSF